MITQPLFWLYLFCHFLILVFLTNRIGIRQHEHWNEVLWTLLFIVGQALPTLGLMRAWDFSASSWPHLAWFWKVWILTVAGWILWMLLDHLRWRFRILKPFRVRLLSDRPVDQSFRPPMDWLRFLGIRNQFFDLHAVTWEVHPPGWPKALDGLSIVQISDVHHNPFSGPDYLTLVREAAKALKPDLFVFTGDYVSHKRQIPEAMAFLKGWKAPMGVYAILGNHDHWADAGAVKRGLKDAGVRLLENETVLLRRKGATLALTGVDDIWVGKREDGKLMGGKADACILLAHQPDHIYLAQRLKANLMLSGHTHGGQIRFPLIGPLVVPADEGRKLASGFQRRGDTLLFIHNGVGAYPPLRVLCPPEVVKLILRASPERVRSE